MSDLLGRLRSVDVSWSQVGEDCAAAADEIERLRAQVKECEEAHAVTMRMLAYDSERAVRAEAQVAALREVLQRLLDEQNGPPLIRDAEDWQAAVDAARAILDGDKTNE